jgi:hypothetical protein
MQEESARISSMEIPTRGFLCLLAVSSVLFGAGVGQAQDGGTTPELVALEEVDGVISGRWSSPLLQRNLSCRIHIPDTGADQYPVVVYLDRLPTQRLGQLDDATLVQQFLDQEMMVIETSCRGDPLAVAPELLPEIDAWYGYLAETQDWPIDPNWIYVIPAGYTIDRDVWICDIPGRSVNMDVFYPSGTTQPVPLMLQITSIKDDGLWINQRAYYIYGLLTNGYAGAVMEHNGGAAVSPKGDIFPEKRAARLFRANAAQWNLSGKLGVTGHSKGSSRAAKASFLNDGEREADPGPHGNQSDRFQASLLSAGQHAIEFLIEDGYLDGVSPEKAAALLEDLASMTPEEIAAISAITYVTPDDPPAFMMVGELDKTFRVNQMTRLANRVDETGLEYEFVIQSDMPHQYIDDPAVIGEVFAFLDRYLKDGMSVTDACFNGDGAFEVTVTGLDTSKEYVLKRSANLQDGFPIIALGPFTPASTTTTVADPTPPPGAAFYRIEKAPE